MLQFIRVLHWFLSSRFPASVCDDTSKLSVHRRNRIQAGLRVCILITLLQKPRTEHSKHKIDRKIAD